MSIAPLLLPVGAGFGYACAAIAIKRSLAAGAVGNRVNLVCNTVMALFFQALWLLPGKMGDPRLLLGPVICGLFFFLGQIFTFRALSTGDISVATPLLGTKVVLVALFSVFLLGKPLPDAWWIASVLASLGIALISYSPGGSHRRLAATVGWSLAAAAVFALTDVLVQHWVPGFGYSRFAPVMFGAMGIFSIIYLPSLFPAFRGVAGNGNGAEKRLVGCPPRALPWLLGGALLLAVQALGIYSAIGLYGSATLTNILYGSRCLWSVLLVWMFSSIAGDFSSGEKRGAIMMRRFLGALLLFGAMALVLR